MTVKEISESVGRDEISTQRWIKNFLNCKMQLRKTETADYKAIK
jgi:predicted transcriptional regulator